MKRCFGNCFVALLQQDSKEPVARHQRQHDTSRSVAICSSHVFVSEFGDDSTFSVKEARPIFQQEFINLVSVKINAEVVWPI